MHVVEFRLKSTASDIKKVDIRLNIARKMYNCVLAALLRRDSAMRSSAEYMATSEERQSISKRFNELSNEYGVLAYALNTYPETIKNGCYFQERLGFH